MITTVVTRSIRAGILYNGGGISAPGHAWLELHHTDGTVESYGYYSAIPNWTSDGVTRTHDADKYPGRGYSSDPIPITSQQADAFRTWAQNTSAAGNWTLPGSNSTGSAWDCATWTFAAFDFANVQVR